MVPVKDLELQYPLALLLFLLIPVILYAKQRYQHTTAFSGIFLIRKGLQPGAVTRYGGDLLVAMFLALSVLAVANLQYSSYWQRTYLESKWIMIVQDMSGSMNRSGYGEGGLTLSDIAITGARSFAQMRDKDDLIGIIGFSSYAKLVCPPTFDKEILRKKLAMLGRESDSIVFRELAVGGATNASYAAWLALCVFFMLLPEENQLSFQEMNDLRYSLLGTTLRNVPIPDKLRKVAFGHGMAIVLFTDGRIEANKSDEDVQKGLPNFVNVVHLINRLGVRLYLISVSGEVNDEVESIFDDHGEGGRVGRIFYMPYRFDQDKIREVYTNINEMEKNRLLTRLSERKRDTRWMCTLGALCFLLLYCFSQVLPRFKTL